jgi:hypothetical protein
MPVRSGLCIRCGISYKGWALDNSEHQVCQACSHALVIYEFQGYNNKPFADFKAQGVQVTVEKDNRVSSVLI